MKQFIKNILKFSGYQLNKFPSGSDLLKINLLNKRDINLIMDVGANTGQFSIQLRNIGYKGKVISFEPLKKEFDMLKLNSSNDKNWSVNNFALGNEDKMMTINVAGNSYSSSFLEMNKTHIDSAPFSKYIGLEEVEMKKLDTFIEENPELLNNNIFLKLDVQGYEKNVILGAEKVIDKIKGIQLELSFDELYKGETLFFNMVEFMKTKNFNICHITPEFSDPDTDRLLQVDTIFFRD